MRTLHTNGMTPGAIAIAIALHEKGLAFDHRARPWQETPAALAAIGDSPELTNAIEGEFPILADGAAVVNDTFFVLEYLDEAYPAPPLRPADAYGQWKVQAVNRFLGERALPAIASIGVARDFADAGDANAGDFADAPNLTPERRGAWAAALTDPANAEVIGESERKARLLLERIEQELAASGGPWLLGEAHTIVDIAAYPLAGPLVDGTLIATDAAAGERTRAWCARMAERPAVQAVAALGAPAFVPAAEHARWG